MYSSGQRLVLQLPSWEGTRVISEDRRGQKGPSCVSRSWTSLAVPLGTDVCELCKPCLMAKEGSGLGWETRILASTVCTGLLPRTDPPVQIYTRGMSSGRSRDPKLSRPMMSSHEIHCACSKRAPRSCPKARCSSWHLEAVAREECSWGANSPSGHKEYARSFGEFW